MVFKHEVSSKECGPSLPLLHWNQSDNLPITRTICYQIKRVFFFFLPPLFHHTSLSWRTTVFGTESSHCFRNVGGLVCLLRRGQQLGPEKSHSSIECRVFTKGECQKQGLIPAFNCIASISTLIFHVFCICYITVYIRICYISEKKKEKRKHTLSNVCNFHSNMSPYLLCNVWVQ